MKIDKTVKKETLYIACFSFLLSLLMQSVFLIIGKWHYSVLLGNLWGYASAVANFLLLGLTVQKAVTKDEEEAKKLIKLSHTLRNNPFYSTVTDLAKLRGWSTSFPLQTAI